MSEYIVPPCKAGDTIYFPAECSTGEWVVEKAAVVRFDGDRIICARSNGSWTLIPPAEWTNICFTREEAEEIIERATKDD